MSQICQICGHPLPGHEPTCPVRIGEPAIAQSEIFGPMVHGELASPSASTPQLTSHQVRMVAAGVVARFWSRIPISGKRYSALTDRMEQALRQELAHFIFIS